MIWELGGIEMAAEAKWTFLIYMAGDNSLSDAGYEDLREMRRIGSTPEVNILAQFDNAGDEATKRYYITKGAEDAVESLGETDSGDPAILNDFISWSVENYPAERYALVLWNHGGGWKPDDLDRAAKNISAKNFNVRQAAYLSSRSMKRAFFSTTVERILSENSYRQRAICSDDITGHSLDTIELGKILSGAKKIMGKSIDILGMDACLMSNLEVAYQASPYVDFIVASEEEEPNQGWPYSENLKILVDKPDIPTSELAADLVKSYTDSYREWGEMEATQSAFDLSRIGPAAKAVDDLARVLVDHMSDVSTDIWKAQKKAKKFAFSLWDISHLSAEINKQTSVDEISQAARQTSDVFMPGDGNFVRAESHTGPWYDQCCGASIYLIMPPERVSKYYAELEFAKNCRNWPLMLQEYLEAP
jgi:hypothetical protein